MFKNSLLIRGSPFHLTATKRNPASHPVFLWKAESCSRWPPCTPSQDPPPVANIDPRVSACIHRHPNMHRRTFFLSSKQWLAVAASPRSRKKNPAQECSAFVSVNFRFPDKLSSSSMMANKLRSNLKNALFDTAFRDSCISSRSSSRSPYKKYQVNLVRQGDVGMRAQCELTETLSCSIPNLSSNTSTDCSPPDKQDEGVKSQEKRREEPTAKE